MTPDLVCLGNLIVDDLVFADGRTRMGEAGGAMLYSALAARLWNVKVGIVSPLGSDYPRAALAALEHHGIDLSGLRALDGPGLRAWLLYEPDGRRVLHHLRAATHAAATPSFEDLPKSHHAARIFHLTPSPRASQQALAGPLARIEGRIVALDPHDPIRDDSLDAWRAVLANVDVLFASEEELTLPGAVDDPEHALARLGSSRLRTLVVKRGERGGVVFDAREGRLEWGPQATTVVDPTGAGDAFAGGFLAGRLEGEDLESCVEQGVVSASFAIEEWGAAGLLGATPAAAKLRQQDWYAERASG